MHPFFSFLISIISTLNFILSFSHHIYVHRQILYQMTESSTVHYRTSKPGYWLKRLSLGTFFSFAPRALTTLHPGNQIFVGNSSSQAETHPYFLDLLLHNMKVDVIEENFCSPRRPILTCTIPSLTKHNKHL